MVKTIGSKRFALGKEDYKKIGKGAFIAVLGALLTYGSQFLSQTDFGDRTPIYVAIWSILVNAGWKYIK